MALAAGSEARYFASSGSRAWPGSWLAAASRPGFRLPRGRRAAARANPGTPMGARGPARAARRLVRAEM